MTATVPPPIRLANDVAAQFHHQPPEQAARAITTHIRSFWEPRMLADLLRYGESDPAALDPLALAAVRLLRQVWYPPAR
ncbi:formate dehydrogenase subunit delta [Amycolatopsis cihanbeyliensis]|uniref:NADH-dependent formate dehydrogenase delta subunit FdsD n=1 Tax=Amycolatopsis cihanbeyliensis TaxID=1128664 RepID=A0A542CTX6_AMYCI|nr:formate dehydrogenase subunit delta [Amycolatopsis cihanbeyliensis]TQI94287.1 NADH-dependent formate dehydrogenase delta subunit FdsD [Amycolatopsis cihanbeyliensis]